MFGRHLALRGITMLLAYYYLAEGGGVNVVKGDVNVGKRSVYLSGPIFRC